MLPEVSKLTDSDPQSPYRLCESFPPPTSSLLADRISRAIAETSYSLIPLVLSLGRAVESVLMHGRDSVRIPSLQDYGRESRNKHGDRHPGNDVLHDHGAP